MSFTHSHKTTAGKAQVAAGSSGVLTLALAATAGDLDWRGLLAALAAGAVTGALTYAKKNHPKEN